MVRRLFLVGLIALTAGIAVYAQQAVSAPRRMLVFFGPESESSVGREELILLYESLLSQLQAVSETAAIFENSTVSVSGGSDETRNVQAKAQGADSWLAVFVGGTDDQIRILSRAADLLLDERIVLELTLEREGVRGVEYQYWDELITAVQESFDPIPQQEIGEMARAAQVTVRGVAGTSISGLGDTPLIVGSDGTAEVSLTSPGLYSYRATKPRYQPLQGTVYIDRDLAELSLEQRTIPRWAVEVYSSNVSFFGAGAAYHWGRFYARGVATTYALGILLRDQEEGDESLFAGVPLTNVFVSGGMRLNRSDASVGLYSEAGGFARIMHVAGDHPRLDPVAPFGGRLAIGAQMDLHGRAEGFVEYGPSVYIADQTILKAAATAGSTHDDMPGGYLFFPEPLDMVTIDLVGFRLGLRWRF